LRHILRLNPAGFFASQGGARPAASKKRLQNDSKAGRTVLDRRQKIVLSLREIVLTVREIVLTLRE